MTALCGAEFEILSQQKKSIELYCLSASDRTRSFSHHSLDMPKIRIPPRPKKCRKHQKHMSPKLRRRGYDDIWEVRGILAEERDDRGIWYFVDWEGTDPATGKDWKGEWIKSVGIDADQLLAAWRREKKRRQASGEPWDSCEYRQSQRLQTSCLTEHHSLSC